MSCMEDSQLHHKLTTSQGVNTVDLAHRSNWFNFGSSKPGCKAHGFTTMKWLQFSMCMTAIQSSIYCVTAIHQALLKMAMHCSSKGRTLSTNLASERLFTFLGRRK